MGVAKKGKRIITVGGRAFLWFLADDDSGVWLGNDSELTIISADKHFLVKYPINQKCRYNHIIVVGHEFTGNGEWGKCYQRVMCPTFAEGGIVTPSVVRQIIDWSLQPKKIVFVNYDGEHLVPAKV